MGSIALDGVVLTADVAGRRARRGDAARDADPRRRGRRLRDALRRRLPGRRRQRRRGRLPRHERLGARGRARRRRRDRRDGRRRWSAISPQARLGGGPARGHRDRSQPGGVAHERPVRGSRAQHARSPTRSSPASSAVFAAPPSSAAPRSRRSSTSTPSSSGSRHCVGVANGTDALELALRAVGRRPGDEVILPANTFIATAEAVVPDRRACRCWSTVDDEHLLIDPRLRRARRSPPRTQAIVPVHLFGQIAPMEELARSPTPRACRRRGRRAVPGRAPGTARRRGRSGGVAATSFYPGKNLGASGDAGAVTTDDAAHRRARCARWRNHGSPTQVRARRRSA